MEYFWVKFMDVWIVTIKSFFLPCMLVVHKSYAHVGNLTLHEYLITKG